MHRHQSIQRRYGRSFLAGIFALCVFIFEAAKLQTLWDVSYPSTESDFNLQWSDSSGIAADDDTVTQFSIETRKDSSSHRRNEFESVDPRSESVLSASLSSTEKPKRVSKKRKAETKADLVTTSTLRRTTSRSTAHQGYYNATQPSDIIDEKKILSKKSILNAQKMKRGENHTNVKAGKPISKPHVVIIAPNEAFLWKGAQSRLCTHIKKELSVMKNSAKGDNRTHTSQHTKINLFARVPCLMIHNRNQHGNFMLGFYGMRIAAMAFNASFTFQCAEEVNPPTTKYSHHHQQQQQQRQQLQYLHQRRSELQKSFFWWLQTFKSSSSSSSISKTTTHKNEYYKMNHSLYHPSQPTYKEACAGMGKVALHYSSEYARRDLRVMAIDMSPELTVRSSLDEVAIHWRCGDVLSGKIGKKDQNYGLLKFNAYKRRIPKKVETIGIVTAPFGTNHSRKEDRKFGDTCKHIAGTLVNYLQGHFPNATITIRNDPSETIPMVFSRLILAKYTFCSRSTFCLFPSIASFGESFVQKGGVGYFFEHIANAYDNIHLMDEPVLLSHEATKRGINYTIQWLTE
jgi:hypothetical protein